MSDSEKPLRLPACANCARRKTKCDRNSPCSNCTAANILCRYVQKRPERKQRFRPTVRYKESLTDINHQLETLSSTLQSLVQRNQSSSRRSSSNDGSNSTPSTTQTVPELVHDMQGARINDQRDYDGEASFYLQLKRIADTLNQAVSSASGDVTNAQTTALEIAQTLIQDVKDADPPTFEETSSQSTFGAFSQYPELAGLSLPPMDSVLRLLAFARTTPQRYFIEFPHRGEEEFGSLCQKLYFPTQSFTIFAWISVNCGLFYLFRELDRSNYDRLRLTKGQVSDIVAACSSNVDKAAKSLRLCVGPSFEGVDALVCAATVSMEGAKGFMAWELISAAARMSIDLGYHRLPPGYGDRPKSQKRVLFWLIYGIDRTLAFNFGRSPTIQDHDVSTERPLPCEDFRSRWPITFLEYIDFTTIQYDIYEQLFSAKAQRQPVPVRVQRVHLFATKMKQLRDNLTAPIGQEDVLFQSFRPTAHDVGYSIEIGFSSILTMIYRMLPPDEASDSSAATSATSNPLRFHPLCVESGRVALDALVSAWHQASTEQDEDAAKMYFDWSSLFVPFMPYIAVFANQITTGNHEDLLLLRKVVKIVETAAEVCNALGKAHDAFSRLLKIAELWMSTHEMGTRGQIRNFNAQPAMALDQGPGFAANGKQSATNQAVVDVNMMGQTASDFPAVNPQDLDMSNQDWDMVFSEFDLGLGAENAREMMPWFEQHVNNFNNFNAFS